MKKLILLFTICLAFTKMHSQKNMSLEGTWKTVAVSTESFYMDAKKDSIELSDKMKIMYSGKIALQNEKAHIRMNYSKNTFVFSKNGDFYFYLGENLKSPIFTGKYTILEKSKLKLNVINRANIALEKDASFYFENGLLYLTMHLETNSPTKYTLENRKE